MSRPIYVPLADVAAAAGVTHYQLTSKYWPEAWACPRDFRLLPRSSTVLVNEASVPAMAACLREAGCVAEAERVMAWLREIEANFAGEDFLAAQTASGRAPWFQRGQYA